MRRIRTIVLFGAFVLTGVGTACAGGDSTDMWVPGVLFSIGSTDGTLSRNGNALSVWLGAGYDLSPTWRLSADFATGHHHIDPDPGSARPVSGTLLLGAATLEMQHIFAVEGRWSPYVAAGAGLSTILDSLGRGYNGWAVDVSAGMEWRISAALGVDAFARWSSWTWQNSVGDNVPPFGKFTLNSIAVGVSVIFHPVFPRQTK